MLWPFAARAQNPPAPAQNPAAPAAADEATGEVGQVATLQGNATVTRGNPGKVAALRINDPIFEHDALMTGPDAALGITFDDQTTFSLSANTRIVVDAFVYQKGGAGNAATFNVAVGTAAFVASLVAKTGDMKITTPSATLGIRGTTGVVEVPTGGTGAGGAAEPRIKLYADANGHVGQIEVFNRQGGRLGALTQSASAFTLTREPGGGVRAVPFQIPPGEAARDRGVLQRLRATHTIGRRMTTERLRTRGPNRQGPNQRTPGHQQQPLNHNQHQGGAPHDGASPHQGGTPHPVGTQHPGGPSPQDRTLHPGGTPHQGGPPNPGGTPRQGGQPRQNMPRTGGPPRGGGGSGARNKRH
jgi:FecR protein